MYSTAIIVGGGPAGSSCAWRLIHSGIQCLILDKEPFPRSKVCAGWVTPGVFSDLTISPADYPHGLTEFDRFRVHVFSKELAVSVRQYAVRRYEFDNWLLQRSGADVHVHTVSRIQKDGDGFVIDGRYRCRYIIGAGGTGCPVYRTFFKSRHPRDPASAVAAMEEEFPYPYLDDTCHLWFFVNKLPGYAWYVPKTGGCVNIGVGGRLEKLKADNDTIKHHWRLFTEELQRRSLVQNHRFAPRGYVYYLRNGAGSAQMQNALIIGDAAGLATADMGEGIGPAVRSGILAADAITSCKPFSLRPVKKRSFPRFRTAARLMVSYLFGG